MLRPRGVARLRKDLVYLQICIFLFFIFLVYLQICSLFVNLQQDRFYYNRIDHVANFTRTRRFSIWNDVIIAEIPVLLPSVGFNARAFYCRLLLPFLENIKNVACTPNVSAPVPWKYSLLPKQCAGYQ